MLKTQVDYWALQETKRHNFATENIQTETNAINREQLNINWFTARENQRHNKEQESIGWTNANENIRHNKATESLGWAELGETKRHNVQMENIGFKNAYANVQQAQAATRRAMADYGRYTLESEMQPYKIASTEAQTKQALANAGYTVAKTAKIPFDMKIETASAIGNIISGTLGGLGRAGRLGWEVNNKYWWPETYEY